MKKSAVKSEKVEQSLLVIFGKPYKLLMEKGDLLREEKKNVRLNVPLNQPNMNYSNNQSERSEPVEPITYKNNVSVMEQPQKVVELEQVIAEMPPFSVEVKQTEDRYIISGETLLKTNNNVKEITEEYSVNALPSENELSGYEEQLKKMNKERYFHDVADAFKGKIINKSNKI